MEFLTAPRVNKVRTIDELFLSQQVLSICDHNEFRLVKFTAREMPRP